MIDQIRVNQLVEVLEEAYDKLSTARQISKDVGSMMKSWAERNEIDVKNVRAVYKNYAAFRDGKLKWGRDDAEDDFTDLLIQVMDAIVEKS